MTHPADLPVDVCAVPDWYWPIVLNAADAYRARMKIRPPGVQRVLGELTPCESFVVGRTYQDGWLAGLDHARTIIEREFPEEQADEKNAGD